jgi:hypothetical protein
MFFKLGSVKEIELVSFCFPINNTQGRFQTGIESGVQLFGQFSRSEPVFLDFVNPQQRTSFVQLCNKGTAVKALPNARRGSCVIAPCIGGRAGRGRDGPVRPTSASSTPAEGLRGARLPTLQHPACPLDACARRNRQVRTSTRTLRPDTREVAQRAQRHARVLRSGRR